MSANTTLLLGGLACGIIAGIAAQYGRLCTFAAIEDAVVAGDFRRARAWALAIAVAIACTQAMRSAGIVDLTGNPYGYARIELGGLLIGAILFGVGMSLVGTCGFGVLVRAGTGDLRAMIAGVVLGIAAFAATGGLLSVPRLWLSDFMQFDAGLIGSATFRGVVRRFLGPAWALLPAIVFPALLATFAFANVKFRKRLRLVVAAILLGLAVSGGWYVTSALADPFAPVRPESLTFVAPLGRTLLIAMGETISQSAFAVASVIGVLLGSFAVSTSRRELRWEAFDDQREMRRHLLGALLMGFGGVLARGCTIGQGISAASTLAVTAPVAIIGMIFGARLGLFYLIEGRSNSRRLGRSPSRSRTRRGEKLPPQPRTSRLRPVSQSI